MFIILYKIDQNSITEKFNYDLINWLDNRDNISLSECKLSSPIEYTFGFTEDQIIIRKDQLNRYGSDLNALSKYSLACFLVNPTL